MECISTMVPVLRYASLVALCRALQPHLCPGSLLFDRATRYETYTYVKFEQLPAMSLPKQLLRLTAFPLCFKAAGELGRWSAYFLTKGETT